ncbi:hypothetical protein CDAR_308111 [Caerostris darwini]|uniref:Uncharacterized protein n=1 Tax=Caerostris darwini TaxID=1538125 RepID=A0AAV4RKE5_9ARAC|nr:hypothetical protein CDAR_308111 [Caerostris darwini]
MNFFRAPVDTSHSLPRNAFNFSFCEPMDSPNVNNIDRPILRKYGLHALTTFIVCRQRDSTLNVPTPKKSGVHHFVVKTFLCPHCVSVDALYIKVAPPPFTSSYVGKIS